MNKWIACTDYKKLPVGEWLTFIENERKPYQVAVVSNNNQNVNIIIVGNCFHWDMDPLIAYQAITPYVPEDTSMIYLEGVDCDGDALYFAVEYDNWIKYTDIILNSKGDKRYSLVSLVDVGQDLYTFDDFLDYVKDDG